MKATHSSTDRILDCDCCHGTGRVWNGLLQEMRGCPDCGRELPRVQGQRPSAGSASSDKGPHEGTPQHGEGAESQRLQHPADC